MRTKSEPLKNKNMRWRQSGAVSGHLRSSFCQSLALVTFFCVASFSALSDLLAVRNLPLAVCHVVMSPLASSCVLQGVFFFTSM